MTQAVAESTSLTYEDAASVLGVQVNTIKQLVYRGILHPIKVPESQYKLLSRAEVEWYDRRRHGRVHEPNPYLEQLQVQQADAALQALAPAQEIQPADLPDEVSGIAVLFLVILLLLALLANKKPDPQKLQELRTAPQLQPVRRAILKLASEIAA